MNAGTGSALTASDFNITLAGGSAVLRGISVEVTQGPGSLEGGTEYTVSLNLEGTIDGSEVLTANVYGG